MLAESLQKTAIVTGGARGIGKAVCKALHGAGYFVVINYNKSEREATALRALLPGSEVFRADVSNKDEAERMARAFPHAELLVNNAGSALYGLFDLACEDSLEKLYGVNLFGTLNASRAFLPEMLARKSGCIINIASVWGLCGASCEVDYSASKAAVIGFTKALAKEVGPSGVRVNCICPGFIDTDMNAGLTHEEAQEFINGIPLERAGKPEDVAAAVAFLAGSGADYITGAVLTVDGGLL